MLGACESGAPPRTLRAVDPNVVNNTVDTPVVLEGSGFLDIPLVALGSRNKAAIRTRYEVRVGKVFDTDVIERLSTEALAFTVPNGIEPGHYDLVLIPPVGGPLQLKAALTIRDGSATDPPARVKLSLETEADGSGEPVSERTLALTESIELFAVLRDEDRVLVGTGELVSFTQEPVLGVLSETYASHTVFSPRLPGDLVLHARSAAALTAEVTLHVQDAGNLSAGFKLSVEDAAGGEGTALEGEISRRAGDQVQWYAVVRDSAGEFVLDVPASWSVLGAESSMLVSAELFSFVPRKVGVIDVTASYGGLEASSVRVRVAPGPADQLSLDPDTATLVAGDAALQFTVAATDAFGNETQDVGALSYEIVDGSFGDFVPTDRKLTPRRAGVGHLSVLSSYGPEHTSGPIEVKPGPLSRLRLLPDAFQISADDAPLQIGVEGLDAFDNVTSDVGTLTWSVLSGNIATLGVTGEFDPTTVGTGTISATSSLGPSVTSGTIEVTPGDLVTLTIQPQTWSGIVGDPAQQLTVTGVDADGNAVTDLGTLSYRVASGTIATVDAQTGLFTPTAAGEGTIEVTSSLGPTAATQSIVVSPQTATLRISAIRAPDSVWQGQQGVRIEVDVASTDTHEVVITGMGLRFTTSEDVTSAFKVVADRANSDRIAAGATQTLIYYVDVGDALGILDAPTVTASAEAFPQSGGPFVFARSTSFDVSLSLLAPTVKITGPVSPADRTCAGGRVSFSSDTTSLLLSAAYQWRFSGGTVAAGFSGTNKNTAVDYASVGNFPYSVTATYLGSSNAAFGTPIYVGRVASQPVDSFPTGPVVVATPTAGQAVALGGFPRSDLVALSSSVPLRQCNNVAVDSTGHTAITIFSDRGLIDPSADVDTLTPGIQVRLTPSGVLGSVPLIAPKTHVEGPTTLYFEYLDATSSAVTAAGDRTFQLSADLQAPSLQWSLPAGDCGAACLSPGEPLVFQFSEPMSTSSLSNTKVELFAGSSNCDGSASTVTSNSERTYEHAAHALYVDPPTRTGTYAVRVQLPSTITDAASNHNPLPAASRCVVYGSVPSASGASIPQLTAAPAAELSPDGDGTQDSVTWKVNADAATSYLRLRVRRAGKTVWTRLAPVPQAGEYTFVWDGADGSGRIVADGMYGYSLDAVNRAGVATPALRGYVEVDSAVRMVSVRREQ